MVDEGLSLDNILTDIDTENLFNEDIETDNPKDNSDGKETTEESDDKGKESNKEKTTEVNTEELFDQPESVGSDKNKEDKEDTDTSNGNSTSQNNFYSSTAKALQVEGIFPDLEDKDFENINEAEDFKNLIEKQINSRLDEKQKRVTEALEANVEPNVVKQYEQAIDYLNDIDDTTITAEGEDGEKLRKQLIFQDFVNRGYSQERAQREVKKSLESGTDIEDAKDALTGNMEFFKNKYNDLIEEGKKQEESNKQERDKQAKDLKESILSDDNSFKELNVDKSTRQQIYDNISKPVYKDEKSGNYYTAIQKYQMEHSTDFLKNVSLIYTLTDGFKNLDGLIKGKVNKEVKKGLKELEHTINNTSRTSDGNLRFVGSSKTDPESFIDKGWNLDL